MAFANLNGKAHVGVIDEPPEIPLVKLEKYFGILKMLSEDSMTFDLLSVVKNYSQLEVTNMRNMQTICKIQGQCAHLQLECRKKDLELEELQKKAVRLEEALKKIEDLEEQLKTSKEATEAKTKELDDTTTELNGVQVNLSSALLEIDGLKENIKEHEEKYETLEKDKKETTEKLENEKKEMSEKLEKDIAEKSSRIDELEKTSNTQAEKLERLNSYALTAVDTPKEEITKHIDGIFTSAFEFVDGCMSEDLDAETFSNANWKKFKDRSLGIPLPPSNSEEAKRMRVAAVLGQLAQAAASELFQPVYLVSQGDDVGELLEEMENYKQADWLRLSMLKSNAKLQKKNARARASAVRDRISEQLSGVLTQEKHSKFVRELSGWCENTANVWMQSLQPMQCKVVTFSDLEDSETDVGEWQPLLPTDAWQPNSSNDHQLKALDQLAARIWPVFTISRADDSADETLDVSIEIVKKGLALTKLQAFKAAEEERTVTLAPPGSYRASRRQRRMTHSASAESKPGVGFLEQGSPAAACGVEG